MPMSVTDAEAGLLAAPWQGASDDDVLEQAARAFFAQTADLTQHGKHDHPTDRIVLGDVAATLALQLGAQPASGRAASLSEYVKLPGSGDGFTITVYADGHEDLHRTAHGPEGVTTAPGADAVVAQYAGVIGHAPSGDELAGFLAARVAGGALPGMPAPGAPGAPGASDAGAAAGAEPAAVLTVRGVDGGVLARGTAAALLGQWSALVALNNAVTPNIELPGQAPGQTSGQPALLNATEGAAFLLGLVLQGSGAGAAGGMADGAPSLAPPPPGLVASYNHGIAWLGQIDQPMLAVAAHWQALAHGADAGNPDRVKLDDAAARLALQVAAAPEGQRGSLSETVHQGGKQTVVTVSQTTTDVTGGAQFHDLDAGIGGMVEQVVGIVADVLSFVPVVDVVAIPVAIAISVAEGAQDLASGDILGGVLALAGAAAGGAGQWVQSGLAAAEIGGAAAGTVLEVAQGVSKGVAAAQGLRGAVGAAEHGDGLAVLTSLAGGVAGSVGAGTDWGRGLAVGSALAGAGVAGSGGDWMGALAATETAAAGAGLFGQRGLDAGTGAGTGDTTTGDTTTGATSAGDTSTGATTTGQAGDVAPPPGWQSAAALPVQQQELAAPASLGVGDAPAAASAAAADAAATQAVAAGSSAAMGGTPEAPGGPGDAGQQQADAQQAAQAQAQQRAGAQVAAQAVTADRPLPVPPVPLGDVPPSPAADANAQAIQSGMDQGAADRAAGTTNAAAQFAGPGAPAGNAASPAFAVSGAGASPDDPLRGGTLSYTLPDGAGPQTRVIAGQSPDGGYWLQGGGFVGPAWVTGMTPLDAPPIAPPAPDANVPAVRLGAVGLGDGPTPSTGADPASGLTLAGTGLPRIVVPGALSLADPAPVPSAPAAGAASLLGGGDPSMTASPPPVADGSSGSPPDGSSPSWLATDPQAVPASTPQASSVPVLTALASPAPVLPAPESLSAATGLPGVDEPASASPTAAERVLASAGQGAARGFGASPLGLSDATDQGLRQIGVYPPAAGGGTLLQNLNEAVLTPAAATADLAYRTLGAAYGAYQGGVSQAGAEIGQPQLGKDLAAMPDAFAGQAFGTGMRAPTVRPVEPVMPQAPAVPTAEPALTSFPGATAAEAGSAANGTTSAVTGSVAKAGEDAGIPGGASTTERAANDATLPMGDAAAKAAPASDAALGATQVADGVDAGTGVTVRLEQTANAATGDLTIASSRSPTGNPSAIVRGFGNLSTRQQNVLDQLPRYGSQLITTKDFGQVDLAALTAATNNGFAMFTTGGRRLIVRGDVVSVPITPASVAELADQGWTWSSHTHPGTDAGVLPSSQGDQAVLDAMGQKQSAIFNSIGERRIFTPGGDSLLGWKP